LVNQLIIKKLDAEETLGTFITCKDYANLIITEDCDLYAEDPMDPTKADEENVIFRYRKGVFSHEERRRCYHGLRAAATESQNRGMAAGPRGDQLGQEGRGNRDWVTAEQLDILSFLARPLNTIDDGVALEDIRASHQQFKEKDETRGQVWLRSEVTKKYPEYHGWFEKWVSGIHNMSREEQKEEAQFIIDNYISDTNYAQSVMSGIAGFYDRYPRIPYGRATSYTEKHPEDFAESFPFLNKLNDQFRKLLPVRWANQRACADKLDPKFLIDGTVFTTLTVNHNWRTACHRDAGDLHEGFSNICALGKGWQGAEFILPEFRIAVKLESGDMLLVNNHGGIHGNDALVGDDNDRMTIVAYFREKMMDLKSWDYEQLRKKYIDERRMNKEHKHWRHLWNGVSPDMWHEQEWYDYMAAHNMEDPYKETKAASLEDFFV
jgi:uncharacterized protein YktA (UPF0223 family)